MASPYITVLPQVGDLSLPLCASQKFKKIDQRFWQQKLVNVSLFDMAQNCIATAAFEISSHMWKFVNVYEIDRTFIYAIGHCIQLSYLVSIRMETWHNVYVTTCGSCNPPPIDFQTGCNQTEDLQVLCIHHQHLKVKY